MRAKGKEGRERGEHTTARDGRNLCHSVFVTQVAPRGSLSLGRETNWGPCKTKRGLTLPERFNET